jgi:REP element-mobilizing transposase RayT
VDDYQSLSHKQWECKYHVVIKGKSAIHIARTFMDRKRNFVGQHFWARGYFVSTVGRDETSIRN